MSKPIVDYVSLSYYYQMNPPKFVLDMLKRIEKRNDIQYKRNREDKEYAAYGITSGEKQTLELFKTGNLNPRSYGTKNEEVLKDIKEGLNLPKKNIADYDSPPISTLRKNVGDIINEFLCDKINSNINNWGTPNLKIKKFYNGWGLIHYQTMLAFRTRYGQFYISTNKYSNTTNKIQSPLYQKLHDIDQDRVHFVDVDGVYEAAGQQKPLSTYGTYGHRDPLWEIVNGVINKETIKENRKDKIQRILSNEFRNN